MFDRDMRYVAASRRWIRDHRLKEPLIGKTIYEVSPDIPERWRVVHQRALEGAQLGKAVDRFPRTDGRTDWLRWEARPWRDADQTIGGIVIFTEVITAEISARSEARRSQQALRESEERFRLLHENLHDPFFQTDLSGHIIDSNDFFREMLGHSAAELHQLTYLDITPEPYRAVTAAIIQDQVLEHGFSDIYQSEFTRKDGTTIPVELRTVLWRDRRGQPTGMWAIVRDITERRRVEALREELSRQKDAFLATLAHELRNPLVPIMNALNILRLPCEDEEARKENEDVLDRALRQMDYLIRLVDDLMDINRVNLGKIELRLERLDLSDVLPQATELVQQESEAKGQHLIVTPPSSPLWIEGDRVRLVQIFANLLINAVRYTDSGGRIELFCERQGSEAVVTVRDDGVGIEPDRLGSIFEPFFQLDYERGKQGVGIGLTLAKKLIELHGGTVCVSSGGRGRGSEFTVRLPLIEASI